MTYIYTVWIIMGFLGDKPFISELTDFNDYNQVSKFIAKTNHPIMLLEGDVFLSEAYGACTLPHESLNETKLLLTYISDPQVCYDK